MFLLEFVESVHLNRKPFHLVGTSMGGNVAGVYAACYPADVCSMTLICPDGRCRMCVEMYRTILIKHSCFLLFYFHFMTWEYYFFFSTCPHPIVTALTHSQTQGPSAQGLPAGPLPTHGTRKPWRLSYMFCSIFQDPLPTIQNMTHFSHMLQHTPPSKILHYANLCCVFGNLGPPIPILDLLPGRSLLSSSI